VLIRVLGWLLLMEKKKDRKERKRKKSKNTKQ
jgi:hypothetical protein